MALEHSAHMKDRSGYKWFCRDRDRFAPGVHAILGIVRGGGEELQSIQFDAERFTVKQAQTWLADNGIVPLRLEAAFVASP